MMLGQSPSAKGLPSPEAPNASTDIVTECVSSLSSCLLPFNGAPVTETHIPPACHLLEGAALRMTDTDPTLVVQPCATALLEPAAELLQLYLACHGVAKIAARPGTEWPLSCDVSEEHVRLVPRPERRAHTAYTAEPVLEWHEVLAVHPMTTKSEPERERASKSTANSIGSTIATKVVKVTLATETATPNTAVPAAPAATDGTGVLTIGAAEAAVTGGSHTAVREAPHSRVLQFLRRKNRLEPTGQLSESQTFPNSSPSVAGNASDTEHITRRAEADANTSTQSTGSLHNHIKTLESTNSPKKVSFESRGNVSSSAASPPTPVVRGRSRSRPTDSARRCRSASVAAVGAGRRGAAARLLARAPRAASPPPPPLPLVRRAVSVAAGGDLWCTTSADWEQEMRLISSLAEKLATDASSKRPETIVYGQLVIHHNCARSDLPRFVRCLSLQRRSDGRGPVLVWLCDAGRTLLVPRTTLLSACSDLLQLYRRPPLLVLLTGKRLWFSVPRRLVSACLSLLSACLPWLTRPAAVSRLADARLPALAAELGSPEALELLSRLTRQPATRPLLHSAEVVTPIADLVGDQLDLAEPDQAELSRLVRLLRSTVGPGLADPARRLLAGSQLVHELLRLGKTEALELDVRRLLTRLQEVESPAVLPAVESSPRPGLSTRATSTPKQTPPSTSGGRRPDRVVQGTAQPVPAAVGPAGQLRAQAQRPPLLPTPPDPAPPIAPGRLARLNSDELRADSDGGADKREMSEPYAAPACLYGADMEFLRRGQRTRLRSGPHLQLEQVKRVQDMGQVRLAMLLCGLLNSGKSGSIYYGIAGADGRVVGLQLEGGQRDRLRLGVDRVVTDRLEPPAPADAVRVQFIPVLDGCDRPVAGSRLDRHSLFVMVVHCQPPPREVFLVRAEQAAYLRRTDADGQPRTVPLSLPQLRQLAIAQEMALVSGHQAPLQSAAGCLRRLLDTAPSVCGDCGGTKPAGEPADRAPTPIGRRREMIAAGSDQPGCSAD